MIIYRIAYIGEVEQDVLYQKAKEYFQNQNQKGEDVQFDFVDISQMNATEILAQTYHMGMFDAEILDGEKSEVLKNLMDSVGKLSDFDFYPVKKGAVTVQDVEEITQKISELSGREEKIGIVLTNISNEIDIESYLDSTGIVAYKYFDDVRDIIEQQRELRQIIVQRILEATARKDEKSGNNYVTYDHINQVGKNAKAFAEFLGWDSQKVEDITFSAYTHDVGKLLIPNDVLNAPSLSVQGGKEQMSPHDEYGGQIIGENVADKRVINGIIGHHGKEEQSFDEDIRSEYEFADFISIIDSFDAMTSQRQYNVPKDIIFALEEIAKNSRIVQEDDKVQFKSKELAENFITFNFFELAKIGFDAKSALSFSLMEKRKSLEKVMEIGDETRIKYAKLAITIDEKLLEIFDKVKNMVVLSEEFYPDKTTALGYKLTEEGYLEYDKKTLKPNEEIINNSEFEFYLKKLYERENPSRLNEVRYVRDLVPEFVESSGVQRKEDTELFQSAKRNYEIKHSQRKSIIEAGLKTREKTKSLNLGMEIVEAAKQEPESYNIRCLQKSTEVIKDMNVPKKQREDFVKGA